MFNLNEKTMDAYRQKINAQIKEMKAKMTMLESEVEKSSADIRIKYQAKVDELKPRLKEIEEKLNQLSDSSQEAWDEIRVGIDQSMSELRTALANATKHFNN